MHIFLGRLALGLLVGAPVTARPVRLATVDTPSPRTVVAPEVLFIRAEHVVTKPGKTLDDVQILVRAGRIVAIGPELVKPDGARELNAKFVCAGFIDPWGAVGMSGEAIVDTATTSATRAIDGLDTYNFDHHRRDALRSGITSTRVQAGANSRIGGVGALIRILPGATREEALVLADCDLWMTIGMSQGSQPVFDAQGDLSGVGSRPMDPFERIESVERLVSSLQGGKNYLVQKNEYKHELEAWQKTIAEKETELEKEFKKAKKDREKAEKDAKDKDKKFEEKKYKEDKKPQPPRYDEDNEVLARAANGDIPLFVFANRVAEIRALLQGTQSLERVRLVLVGGSEAPFFAKELVERRIPVLVWPAPMGREKPDEYESADLSLAGRLAHEGVTVLLGSGGMNMAASRDLPLLAGLAVGNGLDREKALDALTMGAARVLDVADKLGSVESGKDADLLLLDGEPLVSTTHVRYVISAGRVVASPEE